MNVDRLERLAQHLENIEREGITINTGFNMNYWELKHDCGTSACAIGYACRLPEFNEQGLNFDYPLPEPDEDDGQYGDPIYELDPMTIYSSWDAVKYFFDIEDYQAHYLFSGDGYFKGISDPIDVAARIEDFVLRGGEI